MMYSLTATAPPLTAIVPTLTVSPKISLGKAKIWQSRNIQLTKSGLAVPPIRWQLVQHRQTVSHARRPPSAAIICAAALSARCSAEQTQTVTRQSSTITIAPIQGNERSPELDDGGTRLPPRDGGGSGGGGGGGGGHSWSGGFFLSGLLVFLLLLKEQETKQDYRDSWRR